MGKSLGLPGYLVTLLDNMLLIFSLTESRHNIYSPLTEASSLSSF